MRPLPITPQYYRFLTSFYFRSALQLLNLKNDFLRKKFDSIKYDLKKVEEVNFEIVLRGLDKKNPSTATSAATSSTSGDTMDVSK